VSDSEPLVVQNPSGDDRFRRAIERHLLEGTESPDGLQAALRHEFPRVVVRPRDLDGEDDVVWYVYREGHWIRG
jgi:hypothetical protein